MKCAICGIEVETIEEAIENGWIPDFYEGKVEHGPACSSCAETMMGMGEDGEMELKEKYHGKVRYMEGDYGHQSKEEDPAIEIFMADERNGQIH